MEETRIDRACCPEQTRRDEEQGPSELDLPKPIRKFLEDHLCWTTSGLPIRNSRNRGQGTWLTISKSPTVPSSSPVTEKDTSK
jgi:hypothetical protein